MAKPVHGCSSDQAVAAGSGLYAVIRRLLSFVGTALDLEARMAKPVHGCSSDGATVTGSGHSWLG